MILDHCRGDGRRRRRALGGDREQIMRVGNAGRERVVTVIHARAEECGNGLEFARRRLRVASIKQRSSRRPRVVVETGAAPLGFRVVAGILILPDLVDPHENGVGGCCAGSGEIWRAGRAADLRAHRPVRCRRAGGIGVDFGQRNSGAVRTDGPVAIRPIFDPVHQPMIIVAQFESFTGVGEPAGERPVSIRVACRCRQRQWRNRDHEVAITRHDGAFQEFELDSAFD